MNEVNCSESGVAKRSVFDRFVMRFLEVWFSNYKWARKMCGGHWERYWVDRPVCADIWHKVDRCEKHTGRRPTAICRGTPTCEDYKA